MATVKGPLRNVTQDYWTGYMVEKRADGIEIVGFTYSHYPTSEAALASAREKALPGDPYRHRLPTNAWTHLRAVHWQHGVAPKCRKPDNHQVEELEVAL